MRLSFTSSSVRKKRGEERRAERTRQTADRLNAWREVAMNKSRADRI